MTHKEYLLAPTVALILASLSAMSIAQSGSSASAIGVPLSCQGLVGGAMAQCVQGMGSGRAGSETPRQQNPAPAVRETARPVTAPADSVASSGSSASNGSSIGSSISGAISGLFSGWGSKPATGTAQPGGSAAALGVPLNCRGMVGGAMAQCVQGIGSSSSNADVAATADAAEDSISNLPRNFSVGNNSLKCQGLTGGALAQCLQSN